MVSLKAKAAAFTASAPENPPRTSRERQVGHQVPEEEDGRGAEKEEKDEKQEEAGEEEWRSRRGWKRGI